MDPRGAPEHIPPSDESASDGSATPGRAFPAALIAFHAVVSLIGLVWAEDANRVAVMAGVVVDLGIAMALYVGTERFATFAAGIAVVLYGLGWIFTVVQVVGELGHARDVALVLCTVELAGAGSVVLSLWGRATRARTIAAASLFAAYAVALLSFPITLPLMVEAAAAGAEVTRVEGDTLPWSLVFPETGWRELPEDDGTLERTFFRSDHAASVTVRARLGASPATTSLDALQEEAIAALDADQVAVVESRALPRGRLIHLVARYAEADGRLWVGLFVVPGVAYRVEADANTTRSGPSSRRSSRRSIPASDLPSAPARSRRPSAASVAHFVRRRSTLGARCCSSRSASTRRS